MTTEYTPVTDSGEQFRRRGQSFVYAIGESSSGRHQLETCLVEVDCKDWSMCGRSSEVCNDGGGGSVV